MVKLKITRPDGTVIEVEASAADINALAATLGLTWFTTSTFIPNPLGGQPVLPPFNPLGGGGTFYGPKF